MDSKNLSPELARIIHGHQASGSFGKIRAGILQVFKIGGKDPPTTRMKHVSSMIHCCLCKVVEIQKNETQREKYGVFETLAMKNQQ